MPNTSERIDIIPVDDIPIKLKNTHSTTHSNVDNPLEYPP